MSGWLYATRTASAISRVIVVGSGDLSRARYKSFISSLPIADAGRYRADTGGGAGDDPLDFASSTDNSFKSIYINLCRNSFIIGSLSIGDTFICLLLGSFN